MLKKIEENEAIFVFALMFEIGAVALASLAWLTGHIGKGFAILCLWSAVNVVFIVMGILFSKFMEKRNC